MTLSVADPGFPVGGCLAVGGGADLRHGHFLAKMYAKTKERKARAGGAPPGSANGYHTNKNAFQSNGHPLRDRNPNTYTLTQD